MGGENSTSPPSYATDENAAAAVRKHHQWQRVIEARGGQALFKFF